jgi:hypothetical protein
MDIKDYELLKDMLPLASDEAITNIGKQVMICLQIGDSMWPQIEARHGQELLREIGFWRREAGIIEMPLDKAKE